MRINLEISTTREYAKQLDQNDDMVPYQSEFYVGENIIYMDGNSLGLLSKRAEKTLYEIMDSWKQLGIIGWTEGKYPWFFLSEKLGHMTAPLVGAKPEEVIVTGSTTVNAHQLVSTFYEPKGRRTKILADELTFPSDIYALQSQLKLKGYDPVKHLVQVKSRDGRTVREEDIIAAMNDEVALILLPSVMYRSGQILDMERLTTEAQKQKIPIGFDLCHSIGALPHSLNSWGVDFAFWCNYKYLNAGPGGVGGLYLNEKHNGKIPGLSGWFSSNKYKQFDMNHQLTAANTAGAFQIGTPHILSIAPLIGSLEMFHEVGIEKLREKSLQLTQYLMDLVSIELNTYDYSIGNPKEDKRRGGHVYLEHKEAVRINQALKSHHILADFRYPNGIRLAPVPLYNSYTDVWKTVQTLKQIMDEKHYEQFESQHGMELDSPRLEGE